jgi:tRNA(fMet)-specific endonuclease VapC
MTRFMLDSSFCIDVMRSKHPALRDRFKSSENDKAISTIVLHELFYGAANGDNPAHARGKVEEFCLAVAVLPFDEDAASHSAEIRADLRRQGQMIGGYDVLIAGHARSLGLILVTSNMREFTRVPGLRCEDWLQ